MRDVTVSGLGKTFGAQAVLAGWTWRSRPGP